MKCILLSVFALTLFAEPEYEIGGAGAQFNNGIRVNITARAGSFPMGEFGHGVRVRDNEAIYREFTEKKRVVFAYTIEVRPLPQKGRLQVTIKPTGSEYARMGGNAEAATFTTLRELPPMWSGDKVTIDVLENPSTGQKITDTIEVFADAPRVDASEGIRFSGTRVVLNGKLITNNENGGVSGDGIVMFYIPGRGSYFFSREPVPGYEFAKVGVVVGRRMDFVWNGERYEVHSDTDISNARELWVLHDPRKPTGKWFEKHEDAFLQAAAGGMKMFYRDR